MYLQDRLRQLRGFAKPLTKVVLAVFLGLLAFELAQDLLWPGLPKWQSHAIEVVFAAVLSGTVGYFALRVHNVLYQQILEENEKYKKSEEELRRNKEWFRSLTEHGSDLITVIDPKGTILYDSPSIERILGYRQIDRQGKSGFDLVHPEDIPGARSIIERAFQKLGSTHTIEMRVRGLDGRWHVLEATGRAILDHEGKLRGVINSRDITERKQIEETLRKSERQHQLLLNSTGEGIYGVDLNGFCTFINHSAAQMFGYASEEILGKHIHELIHHTRPDGSFCPASECRMYKAYISGQGCHSDDEVFWRRDGTSFQAHYSSFPIIENGVALGAVAVFMDITERKQAEEKLRLQTAALEAAANGIVIADRNGAITWINQAFTTLTGYSAEEVVGQNPRLLKSGFQDPAFYANLWSTITSGRSWHGELVNKRKDGIFYTDEMTITPVRNTQGEITHFIAIKHDITERKQLERQARQMSRLAALGQLIGGIAHEMKNPLFILTGRIQMAREKLAHQEYAALESDMKKIDEAGERMKTIADRFMTIAKPVPPHQEQCSIQAILHKSMESLANELTQNRIRVATAFAPDLPEIRSDPRQLYEVFLNLMQNAVQAMTHVPGERLLTVSAAREGNWVVARIQDNGPGIASEYRAGLFEPFFAAQREEQGIGLGLWIVRSTLMMLKSEIVCESETGKGTTFIVRLPINAEESKP